LPARIFNQIGCTFRSSTYAFMRTTAIISLAIILLASCGFRLFENSHRLPRPAPNNRADSILVLDLGETIRLPDSRAVVGDLIVKAPCQIEYGYTRLLAYSRFEAARVGGNLLKVNEYGGFLRQKLYATIYRLDSPDLTRLKDSLAATLASHQDSIRHIAVVHVKDFDDIGKRRIWFNGSLVDSIKGRGFDGLRGVGKKTLAFHAEGVLRLGDNYVALHTGKEYYIVLREDVGRHYVKQYLFSVDKVHFDHRNMVFEQNLELSRP
jgi:hypothetical protein